MRCLTLIVLAGWILLASCTQDEKGAGPRPEGEPGAAARKSDGTDLVDEDYRFALSRPGSDWRLLGEKEIQKIVPSASAGAMSMDGFFGVVIVEPFSSEDLQAYARLLVDTMALEEKQPGEIQKVQFQGRPALRFSVVGVTNGMRARFQCLLFANGDHAYQLMAWGLAAITDPEGSAFSPFFDAFRLLPGEVRGRSGSHTTPDTSGVGWRVQNGVFESASYRLRVKPAGSFRLAIGTELSQMNNSAEVGLVANREGVYLILIFERAAGVDPAAFADKLQRDTMKNIGSTESLGSARGSLMGRPLEFIRFRTTGAPKLEYWHAVRFEGDQCMQVLVWSMAGQSERMEKLVPEALDCIQAISAEEAAALQAQLDAGPDAQNQIGATFSLRRGTYLDFENRLQWKKPRGNWRILVGEDARRLNPVASLYFEEPSLGLFGLVVGEPSLGNTAESYHAAVAQSLFGDRRAKVEPIQLGRVSGRMQEDTLERDGIRLRYRVASAVSGDRAYQIHVWGMPDNVAAAKEQAKAVLEGFALDPEGLSPVERSGAELRDRRFGFSFSPPPGWSFADKTPAGIRSIGTLYGWEGQGQSVLVLALCTLQMGQDEKWFMEFLQKIIRERVRETRFGEPKRENSTLGGLPAQHLSWKFIGGVDAYFVMHDRTFYALIASRERNSGSVPAEKIKAGFAFMD
jgi:hypothetical protein